MLFHAQGECLRAAHHEPGIERGKNRPGAVLHEPDPLGIVFVVQNHNPADAVRVAVQIFRSRVHDDIDAKLERPLQVWGHESVVANDARSRAMRDLADLFEVRQNHDRVRWCFNEHHFRVRLDRSFDVQWIRSVDVIEFDVVVGEYAIEETCGAAVSVVGNDDVLAGFYQTQRGIDRGHA